MKTSKFLSLNLKDILKGLIMAVLTPAVLIIQQSLSAEILVFNWKAIGIASLSGGLAYLIKNFFTGKTNNKQDLGGGTAGTIKT